MSYKIIIIGTAHPYRGGLASFNHRMSQELINQGHNVTIFNFTLQYPNFLFPGKTQFSEDEAPGDLDIIRNVNSINPLNWVNVAKKVRKLNPDIVICKFWIPFIAPCIGTIFKLINKPNLRRIAVIDNIVPHEKRMGDKLLSQYFVNNCDEFVVMSKQVEEEMRQFTVNKPVKYCIHPIYDNYGDVVEKQIAKTALKLNNDINYIMFFGLIRGYKGLDLLLESVDRELYEQHNVKLIVAGEFYGDKQDYLKIIDKKNISNLILLRDFFIPNEDVKHYFCSVDLVVQPYKTATQSGISQIAYHFNKPMLVTNVGGLPEVVEHNVSGYVVERDPLEIAKSIDDFYRNNRELSFVEVVKEKKKKYGWNLFVNRMLDE